MNRSQRHRRRGVLVVVLLAATMAAGLTHVEAPASSAAPSRPNIVVVMLDDLKYEPTERLLRRMPTLKRIFVDGGRRFQRYFGNDPLCCPGRAAFLTGLYSHNHRVIDNDARQFNPRDSLAVRLRQGGYWTTLAGKYFNGFELLANKYPPGWDVAAITSSQKSGGVYLTSTGMRLWRNGVQVTPARPYQADLVRVEAVRAQRQAPVSKPTFTWLSFYAPHAGTNGLLPTAASRHVGDSRCTGAGRYWSPAYNEADVSDKPAAIRALPLVRWSAGWPLVKACESMLSVDQAVAALERELSAQGRLDNTIWVLTSDNGMAWGEHRIKFKRRPYTTQMPLYIAGPGIRPGSNADYLSSVDLGPTLAALGGVRLDSFSWYGGGADGISFAPLVTGGAWAQPRRGLLEERRGKDPVGAPFWAVRTTDGRWHYVEYDNGERELYDLRADPWELNNIAGLESTRVVRGELATILRNLRAGGTGGPSAAAQPPVVAVTALGNVQAGGWRPATMGRCLWSMPLPSVGWSGPG